MNESQLDPKDRTSTPAPRPTKSPANWKTVIALLSGVMAAFKAFMFFTTGDRMDAVLAVAFGLTFACGVWDLLRSPSTAPRQDLSPIHKVTLAAIFGFLAVLCAFEFLGKEWGPYWAVVTGLIAAVLVWDLLRSSTAQLKKVRE